MMRRVLICCLLLVVLLPATVLILARFNNLSLKSGEKIIVGYDERHGRFQILETKTYSLDGIDGPYITGNKLYRITKENILQSCAFSKSDTIRVTVGNPDNDIFSLVLKDRIVNESDCFELPDKLIVISDIEGNFDGFSGFLINNGVMNKDFSWTFGSGHLILNGDFVDRGEYVTPVLWLIYKLESEAEKQNGKVHFILGNHEVMNFQGNAAYSSQKYKRAARLISNNEDMKTATAFMYSDKTELGKWLRSKNVIEKIGKYLFVHAGICPDILKYKVTVSDINRIARSNWDKDLYSEEENNKVENFITGKKGVYWYRGLATEYKYYPKVTENELSRILEFFGAEKIVFGHTLKADITTEFNGRTINTDVKHGQVKNSDKTRGLLIEKGTGYILDGLGEKTKL